MSFRASLSFNIFSKLWGVAVEMRSKNSMVVFFAFFQLSSYNGMMSSSNFSPFAKAIKRRKACIIYNGKIIISCWSYDIDHSLCAEFVPFIVVCSWMGLGRVPTKKTEQTVRKNRPSTKHFGTLRANKFDRRVLTSCKKLAVYPRAGFLEFQVRLTSL